MKPYKHQEELSDYALDILREHAIVYLAMEERTGKTLIAILAAEKSTAKKVLVITKKKAIDDWNDTLAKFKHDKIYLVVNYHQAHKYAKTKFDLVILDEAHNYISSFPKPGTIWKKLKPMLTKKPIIYLSATPHAQGYQMLYHQFALSIWSPWHKYKNFYKWFDKYGKPYSIEVRGQMKKQYDRCYEDLILESCKHLFISKTRAELDFEHEPEDIIHWIELDEQTKLIYNKIVEDELVQLPEFLLICDTTMKLRTSLHQLEGGTMKVGDERFILANIEKIDYILKNFGDNSSLVIMYNYKAEYNKLNKYFSKAKLLQATSYAEGIDLHKYKDLVIYSQDFSTARHTQRRARQANMERKDPIKVHYLLVKGGLSAQVYKTVSKNKRNFVDSVFERNKI